MNSACYRVLHKYKYQLTKSYDVSIGIDGQDIHSKFISLDLEGFLHIEARYAWDGPSGPTRDTRNFMRGSLVHDALYQLIREGQLPGHYRDYADRLLRKMCIQDGMSRARARMVYLAVKWFGGSAVKPDPGPQLFEICVPPGGCRDEDERIEDLLNDIAVK